MEKPTCQHQYVAGPKKGQVCGRFVRKGGPLCGQHNVGCEHDKQHKSRCSDCLGHSINKNKCSKCKKPFIPKADQLQTCYDCRYYSDCPHGIRIKKNCAKCKYLSNLCIHQIKKSRCSECDPCIHNNAKEKCYICNCCEHKNIKKYCVICSGCEHQSLRFRCKDCNPQGYMRSIISNRIYQALKSDKKDRSIEYLGCTVAEFMDHIESQFKEGMTWGNHGEWHIDHIIPIKYDNPTIEDVIVRLHWTNTQPLWANENMSKGNRFVG
jgi:hypothetical protein